jgi:hypothetical protein
MQCSYIFVCTPFYEHKQQCTVTKKQTWVSKPQLRVQNGLRKKY